MTWYRSSAGVNGHAEDEMNERVIIYTKNWYFLGLQIFTCILNCLFHIRGKKIPYLSPEICLCFPHLVEN